MIYAILTICLFGSAFVEASTFGRCPEVQTHRAFELSKFMGIWYEARHYVTYPEVGVKCINFDYRAAENKSIHMTTNKVVALTGQQVSIEILGRVPDAANPAKLKVKLAIDPVGVETDYWVLGTDYSNYAVVYNCVPIQFMHYKMAWILTREREPEQSVIDQAIEVASSNNLSEFLFKKSDQSNC